MIAFVPLGDRALIQRTEKTEEKRGGLYIPDVAKEKPHEGIVIAVGEGRYEKGERIPMSVKAGDHVLFGKYSGAEIKINGDEFLIVKEEEIFGIVTIAKAKKAAS